LILAAGCRQGSDQETAIRACFNSYKTSVLAGNGEEAVQFVDANTLAYFEKMLELALHGEAATVKGLSALDKLMVLLVRFQIEPELLSQMDGRQLYVYSIDEGLVDREGMAANGIGKVTVNDGHAEGDHVANGVRSDLKYAFHLEDGEWKLDITSIYPAMEIAIKLMARNSRMNENDYLLFIVELDEDKKVTPEIWQPLIAN